MPRVNITRSDGEPASIEVVGDWPDYESVLEAHGYDPDAVEWSVDDPESDLSDAIQSAANLQELKDALDPKSEVSPGAQARNAKR